MFNTTRNSDTVALEVITMLIQRELNEPTELSLATARLTSTDYGRLQTSLAKYVELYTGLATGRKRYDTLKAAQPSEPDTVETIDLTERQRTAIDIARLKRANRTLNAKNLHTDTELPFREIKASKKDDSE